MEGGGVGWRPGLRGQVAILTSASAAAAGAIWLWLHRRADSERKNSSGRGKSVAKSTPPRDLHATIDPSAVTVWDPQRFQFIRWLQDATRNHGQVNLMYDKTACELVAVKQIPNSFMCASPAEFAEKYPGETEFPWQDIGCIRFLESAGFPYICRVRCVARDDTNTYLVYEYATEGDLFTMATNGISPGPEREAHLLPVVRRILDSVKQLHDLGVAHRDISPENVVCSRDQSSEQLEIKLIDFAMATSNRHVRGIIDTVGKPAYTAPEYHADGLCDAFLGDAFSVGVLVYAVLMQDYPWISTRPGACKRFQYVEKHGMDAYMAKQKLRGTQIKIGEIMSGPLKQLLVGLLHFDPALRLTLGESAFPRGRASVWDEAWLRQSGDSGFG